METDTMQNCGSTGDRCKTASKSKSASQFGGTTKTGQLKKVENSIFSPAICFGMIPAYTKKYMEALQRTGQDDDTQTKDQERIRTEYGLERVL